ncbi:MAG: glycoside hydrolase family protein [Bacilli bacterium]
MKTLQERELSPLGMAPLFRPEDGQTILHPPGEGAGFWVGAPTVMYDEKDHTFYLYYRVRNPRGFGDDERGFEVRIAKSADGQHFEDVWRMHKKELHSSSIERSALVKVHDGLYRLYISYVDSEDNRWRIDVMEANTPTSFDPKRREKVFAAADLHVEGVKDPYVKKVGSRYYMYFVYAKSVVGGDPTLMHHTGDVHNTGYAVAPTGLAISEDGIRFTWLRTVLPVGIDNWDRYQSRLTTIIPFGSGYTVLWDGSKGVEENFEEKGAVAVTYDLISFAKVSVRGPALQTSLGNAVRYVDALVHDGWIWYYYEYAREDGAHELRLCKVRG